MANEAALHGPHAFPLERLLSIFWQLMRAEADVQLNAMGEQAADIFSQIASLTCLRLLIQVLCLGSPGQHAQQLSSHSACVFVVAIRQVALAA